LTGKISFGKVNFSNGIHKHMAKRYLFTTDEKKIACAVENTLNCT
jgi:hypothetical protein